MDGRLIIDDLLYIRFQLAFAEIIEPLFHSVHERRADAKRPQKELIGTWRPREGYYREYMRIERECSVISYPMLGSMTGK
jgi:hypothetical protein